MELAATTITIAGRRGWQPKGSLAGPIVGAVIVGAIIAAWAVFVAVTLGSVFAALFALSVTVLIAIALAMLVVKIRGTRPLRVRVIATDDSVTFDAGTGVRRLARWLPLPGALLMASMPALLMQGELYGERGTALFSGVGRYGVFAFFAVAALVIWVGVRAWAGSGAAALTLTRDGVKLTVTRTGGQAAWHEIAGAHVRNERATVLASGGSMSWAVRDLASDPVVVADLITYYAEHPAARAHIGSVTVALLQSARF